MTPKYRGAISYLATAGCVDVALVVPALLNAAGRLMLIVGPRSHTVGVLNHRYSLTSPRLVLEVNGSNR